MNMNHIKIDRITNHAIIPICKTCSWITFWSNDLSLVRSFPKPTIHPTKPPLSNTQMMKHFNTNIKLQITWLLYMEEEGKEIVSRDRFLTNSFLKHQFQESIPTCVGLTNEQSRMYISNSFDNVIISLTNSCLTQDLKLERFRV